MSKVETTHNQSSSSLPRTAPKLRRRSKYEELIFTLPGYLFQLSWAWYPLVIAFVISFTAGRIRGDSPWTGIESYSRLWNDPLVLETFKTTFIFAGLSLALTFMIPIFIAVLLLEMPPKIMRWMMLLWFLPLSSIASTIFWRYLYNPDYGAFQAVVKWLGLPPQQFLNDPRLVLFWLVFPSILLFGPGLIYLATLQSVPSSYFEAAEIEGAGFWRKIWTISIPRIRPIISMTLILGIIATLQAFDFPQLMTGGAPGGTSRMVVMYLYDLKGQLRLSDATALSIFLFIAILIVVMIFNRLFKADPDT